MRCSIVIDIMNFIQFLNKEPVYSASPTNTSSLKVGDLVRVRGGGKEGDPVANIYKGYIGEIKECKKSHNYAIVVFHAMNVLKPVRIYTCNLTKINH